VIGEIKRLKIHESGIFNSRHLWNRFRLFFATRSRKFSEKGMSVFTGAYLLIIGRKNGRARHGCSGCRAPRAACGRERLRVLREDKKLSQGDIRKKTGLHHCYVSRFENGQTIPSVETVEKFARALEVPMYQLFYKGGGPPKLPNLLKRRTTDEIVRGNSGKDAHILANFCHLFGRMKEDDRKMLFFMAQKMAKRKAS
jgi:transcriptional regulator with XRE-family HTH domain